MADVKIFALTSRGLEGVCAGEISQLQGIKITGVSYRKITALCSSSLLPLLSLRTVDDVFLHAATWKDILPQREALTHLKHLSAGLSLEPLIVAVSTVRPIPRTPVCSVTASFVGKRNYSWKEICQAVTSGLQANHPFIFDMESGSQLNVRLFIEHKTVEVGLRLGERALHQRPYKQVHLEGSLKPSVAAALVSLSQPNPGDWLLDPCCGAGTILVEGGLMGMRPIGGDIQSGAVSSARINANSTGMKIELANWDGRSLPLAGGSVPRIVTNLPWGRQVVVDDHLTSFYRTTCLELERLLSSGGRIVLLTSMPELVQFPLLKLETQFDISLFGQNPHIMIFVKP